MCRFQVRVCAEWNKRKDQDNWLFTQHISKDFDYSVHNYAVNITVQIIYAVQSCRLRILGCNMEFRLLNYKTNTSQLPSTTGRGYMNTENYEQFGKTRPISTLPYFEKYNFTLDPSDTGFYVAIRDTGTCVGISSLRVYHYTSVHHVRWDLSCILRLLLQFLAQLM